MCSRNILTAIIGGLALFTSSVAALEFREEPYRVGIVDVGEPILLDYTELTNEMQKNTELRDWVHAYGRPEYAEYQRVELNDPFLPYEIRLYYIAGRRYVAFGGVSVAPSVKDFGVRKYIGKLDSAIVRRILTARPDVDNSDTLAAASLGSYEGQYDSAPSANAPGSDIPAGEEVVVEKVIEIPQGESSEKVSVTVPETPPEEVVIVEADPATDKVESVEIEPEADSAAVGSDEDEEVIIDVEEPAN